MTTVKCPTEVCKFNDNGICIKDTIIIEELAFEGIFCTTWESKHPL